MSTTSSSGQDHWSGDMLDRPELVEAFTAQLRQVLSAQADYVARIRRDAEAMWKANRPEGYSTFEAWWRHRWVTSPFGEIQAHIEKAATLTFELEARYRRGRHEIPAAREAAAQARQVPAIPGPQRTAQPKSAPRAADPPSRDFIDLIRDDGRKRSA
ncbi:hypothetical protein GCM10023194_81470 [Planotetraspora phitsanulokensis]|uniref:Uncharacterized protein n=1 Tax=Planotetraspora phitsanulokensis TaxID=575192 RepID=A0A8J3UGJ9_9ACTN|nr:hypothetical protein [Planotetraspora phitsanulokensis]GII42901.1 hypothetical protein Pph01_79040 [Planotetraspora phitsanulokensis]